MALHKEHTERFTKLAEDARSRIRETTVAAVRERIDSGEKFHLVDVREESEWAEGHLPGAFHLGRGIIERDIEEHFPDYGEEIVLYCGGGYRSALAADSLRKMGYANVISMDGGYRGWTDAGYPVDLEPAAANAGYAHAERGGTMTATTATGATPGVRSIPQRLLGKTGELVPVLGLGTGPGGLGMKDDDAIALYQRALDLGITYFDTAPGYGGAHRQLGEILPPHREGLFLASKAHATDFDEALRIVEQSLKDLRVDRLDLVYVHSVGNLDPEAVLSGKGSLAGLREAQRQGMTRFVGITAHHMPDHSARILKAADVDVGMFALNPGDRHTYNFEEKVLPLARAQDTGVAAMKVYGGASEMKYELDGEERFRPTAMAVHGFSDYERAFRYCLDLPGVAVNVIGMYRDEEIEQNIELACGYEPLEEIELAMLVKSGVGLGRSWGEHFGPAG